MKRTGQVARWRRSVGSPFVWIIGALIGTWIVLHFASEYTRPGRMSAGAPMPAFRVVKLIDQATPVSLDEHRGKVVLLSVWATWCMSCSTILEEQEELAKRYGSMGLTAVAISVDKLGDSDDAIQKLQKFAPSVEGWLDLTRSSTQALQIRGLPQSYLVDQRGRLLRQEFGVHAGNNGLWTSSANIKEIERALAQR